MKYIPIIKPDCRVEIIEAEEIPEAMVDIGVPFGWCDMGGSKDDQLKKQDVYIIYSRNFLWSYDKYINFLINNNLIEEIYESPEGLNSESYEIYEFIN